MTLTRRPNNALAATAVALSIAATFAPPRPVWAGASPAKVLPPGLGPIFADVQRDLAASGAPTLLLHAPIAIQPHQVLFTHPQTGVLLLALEESPSPPWFQPSASALPPLVVQDVLGALGRRLDRSPWQRPTSASTSRADPGQPGDPWADEPMRSLTFAFLTAAAFWTLTAWILLASLRRARRWAPPPAPSDLRQK